MDTFLFLIFARACALTCASEGSLFAFIVMGQNGLCFIFGPSPDSWF